MAKSKMKIKDLLDKLYTTDTGRVFVYSHSLDEEFVIFYDKIRTKSYVVWKNGKRVDLGEMILRGFLLSGNEHEITLYAE